MYCKNCGQKNDEGAKFCVKCGTVAEAKQTAEAPAITVADEKPKSFRMSKTTLGGTLSTLVFIAAFVGVRYLVNQSFSPSTQDLVHQAVQHVKDTTSFPSQIDSVTTATGITEEKNTIHYHYILHDVDSDQISNTALKNVLVPFLCQNSDTRVILDKGISVNYSYHVENSTQNYFVSVTQTDCI